MLLLFLQTEICRNNNNLNLESGHQTTFIFLQMTHFTEELGEDVMRGDNDQIYNVTTVWWT